MGVTQTRVNNLIWFLDNNCLGLGHEGQIDNIYDFLKECFITSKIL